MKKQFEEFTEMSDELIADVMETSVALFMAKTIMLVGEQVTREDQLLSIISDPSEKSTHQLAAMVLLQDWDHACKWAAQVMTNKLATLQKRN